MSDFAITFFYRDIFPIEDNTKLLNAINSYSVNVSLYTGTMKAVFFEKIAKLLFNRYANSNVRYDTEDAFKRNFIITLDNLIEKIGYEQKQLDLLYKLTEDDMIELQKSISIGSDRPNDAYEDPLNKILDYVSFQSANKITRNKLAAYIAALQASTDRHFEEYIYEFNKHFIQVFVSESITYQA